MAVEEVWGIIEGGEEFPISHEGDQWSFPVPRDVTGYVVVEIWARDVAGNVAYRAAVLETEDGTVKCVRWLTDHGLCTMILPLREETVEILRPTVKMERHECIMGVA